MLVSFLCPSRGRPELLARSVASLASRTNRTDWEVLVALDDDDPQRTAYDSTIVSIYSGERKGYARLNETIADLLIPHAKGHWVWLWNDDALMETQDWLEVLAKESADGVLCPKTNHENGSLNVFPIIPKAWIAIAGWAKNGANDTWFQVVGSMIDRHRTVPISILHDRADLTGNNNDATRLGNSYDPSTFFNTTTYARMGFAAGRIYDRLYRF